MLFVYGIMGARVLYQLGEEMLIASIVVGYVIFLISLMFTIADLPKAVHNLLVAHAIGSFIGIIIGHAVLIFGIVK